MQTFGPLYVGKLDYYHKKFLPILEVGTTQETEKPYRKGKCIVLRVPFTIPAVYVGLFGRADRSLDDEDVDALLVTALKAHSKAVPFQSTHSQFNYSSEGKFISL